jgi:hypothetical protein
MGARPTRAPKTAPHLRDARRYLTLGVCASN